MSRLYDVAVLGGDDPGSWLCAAVFAKSDLRVALIMDQPPCAGVPPFFQSLCDPCRSRLFLGPLGISPCRGPVFPFDPDFQIIVNGRPIDFTASPIHAERAMERDFRDHAALFQRKSQELSEIAEVFMDRAREKKFPALRHGPLSGLLSSRKPKADKELAGASFNEWASDLPPLLKHVFRGVISLGLGAVVTDSAPLLQAALLWHTARSLSPDQDSAVTDLREEAAQQISRRGSVMEATPEALLYTGRTLYGIRLAKGAIIDTRMLISPSRLFYRMWTSESKRPSFPERASRKTRFLKIERSTLPESLCSRALIIDEASPDSMILMTRAPRVPRRDTMCVTFYGDDDFESEEEVISKLSASLSWLDPAMVEVDDTREPVVKKRPAPSSDLLSPYVPKFPLWNVMVHPAEVLPSWGPLGTTLSLLSLRDEAMQIIHKLKKRRS